MDFCIGIFLHELSVVDKNGFKVLDLFEEIAFNLRDNNIKALIEEAREDDSLE